MIKKRIHFMGIGGSGMSSAAIIAKKQGYNVTGCDQSKESTYLAKVKKVGIPVVVGHSATHIKNFDILTVSPAIIFENENHPEVIAGRKKTLLTWQGFVGKYLQDKKRVICVSGTHGKSTVTTMAGFLYENAKLDPTVVVGANFKPWKSNFRYGKGDDFLIEADEFYANFLNYKPDSIIINNIEFDHPDFFKSEEDVVETFEKFVANLCGNKLLILNQDSKGVSKLIKKIGKGKLASLNVVGYTLSNDPVLKIANSYEATIKVTDSSGFEFQVVNKNTNYNQTFRLNMLGSYNVSNALGLLALAKFDNISDSVIKDTLRNFPGAERRMQFIGSVNEIKIYDDYAHHPTAIKETLKALRQKFPDNNITCIVEPHTFSRTEKLLKLYKNAFKDVDTVVIAPIYKSRDKKTYGMSNQSVVIASGHKNALALNSFDEIIRFVKKSVTSSEIIIVMGAGKSYVLAKSLVEKLK